MGFIVKLLLPIIIRAARTVVEKTSPEIRKQIESFVTVWERDAKATPNPWDDILVLLVKGALGVKDKK
jgi:hypothetical protein